MALPNIFEKSVSDGVIERIEKLSSSTQPQWGKMKVHEMLAHCNVTYEMIFEEGKHPKPGGFMRLMLKLMVKNKVVGESLYKPNSPTGPQFLIKDERSFNQEKQRLIDYIRQTQQLGSSYFEGRISHSFGKLTAIEWNNMLYKHLDHHLTQFGV